MATNPDNIFADLIPNNSPAPAVYGAPVRAKEPAVPSGWERDPDNPSAIRPMTNGPEDPNAGGILGDETKDFFAQQVLTGAALPSIGYGKDAARAKQDIMNRVAKMAGAEGMSGTDFAAQIAHYKAGQTSISNMTKMHDTVSAAERAATLNGQQFIDRSSELPHQGGGPILNAVTQAWERNVPFAAGHETVAAMDASYQTFIGEYNKVVNGSPSGAGTMSDASRKEAQDTMRNSYDPSQKARAFAQMKKDMANRMDAINSVIADQYKSLTRRYDQYSVPDDPAQAALSEAWIKAHPDSLAAMAGGGKGGDNGGGGSPNGAGYNLTPDQRGQLDTFLKDNPAPSEQALGDFLGRLLGKKVANVAALHDHLLKTGQISASVENLSEEQRQRERQQKLRDRIAQEDKIGVGESPAEALSAQGRTFSLSDEASGVGNALSNAVVAPFSSKTNFDPVGSYQFGRDAERMRIDDARQQLGYGGSALEFASSLASVNPAGALDAVAPRSASAIGALAGFGSGDGAADSLERGGVGALGGYAVGRFAEPVLNVAGKAVSKVIPQALKTRLLPSRGMAPEVADAAQAEGVDLIRPMVDAESRGKYATLESSPASQSTIRSGFTRVLGQIEDKVKSLGGGTPFAEADQAGEAAQQGGKNWLASRTSQKNRLYKAAEDAGADAMFVPQKALAEADATLAELKANPNSNAGEIAFMQGIRDDLATKGGKSISQIRNIRENIRTGINQNGLTMDGAGVRALKVLNAAKSDIADAVPQASNAYNRADQYFSASQGIVDDLEASILGTRAKPIEPQVALKNLRAMMSNTGTGRRYARIMQALDTDTRQDIAATWANALGRSAPDAPFELRQFLGQTGSLSPSALRTAFGPEGAESVKNLRVVAQALKDTGSDVNYSRSATTLLRQMGRNLLSGITGLGTAGGALLTHNVEGAGMGAAAGIAAKATGVVRQVLSARAMVNPRVSRWLAEVATVNNRSQAHAAMRKLSVIISREPALASELTPLYARISNALSGRMEMPLAAQPAAEGQNNDGQ